MTLVPIHRLKLYPSNPRQIKKKEFAKLKESIKRKPEGLTLNPIICNEDNEVLDGNMRLLACKDLGYKELPVNYVPDDWNETDQKEWVVLANTHAGTWDTDILANEFPETILEPMSLPSWTAPTVMPQMERIIISLPDMDLADKLRDMLADFLKDIPDATIR